MKKEKRNLTNIATAAALSLLCIGVLGGAIWMNRQPETEFVPAASEESTEGSWSEPETKPAQASIPKEPESQARFETGSPEDEIQVVAKEGDEVVIDLTPPVTKPAVEAAPTKKQTSKRCPDKPTAAETAPAAVTEPAPETAAEPVPESFADSESAPSATATPEPAPSEAPAPETTPAADDHAGQVYDPVFGWLTPGTPQADVLDNDGDVNKQIGYIE